VRFVRVQWLALISANGVIISASSSAWLAFVAGRQLAAHGAGWQHQRLIRQLAQLAVCWLAGHLWLAGLKIII